MKSEQRKQRIAPKAASQRAFQHRLRLETLEDRRLLAGMPELLRDINMFPTSSIPQEIVEVGGIAYCSATISSPL